MLDWKARTHARGVKMHRAAICAMDWSDLKAQFSECWERLLVLLAHDVTATDAQWDEMYCAVRLESGKVVMGIRNAAQPQISPPGPFIFVTIPFLADRYAALAERGFRQSYDRLLARTFRALIAAGKTKAIAARMRSLRELHPFRVVGQDSGDIEEAFPLPVFSKRRVSRHGTIVPK